MKKAATLVFDIGKTTKKVLVFDSDSHVLEERTEHFEEIADDDGFPAENLQLLSAWVKQMIAEVIGNPAYNITHVNFSAYGASLVHLDGDNKVVEPFYNYLKPLPNGCEQEFLNRYNANAALSTTTSSPWLAMLNSGVQLYWLKYHKPAFFNEINCSLHFPQYFPFLITGEKFSEITSIGCHTMLWNFQSNEYHQWVEKEGMTSLFPLLKPTTHSFDYMLHGKRVKVGVGVHDSSAALMPYLVTMKEPFILLSTGTWNIAFNPFNNEPLTGEELKKDCLCYMTYEGKPVKASRIFLGHEYEVQNKLLAEHFKVDINHHKGVQFNEKVLRQLISENDQRKIIYPVGMEGTGPIPERQTLKTDLSVFQTFEEAYHQLIRTLVQWQILSLDLVDPQRKIKTIIVVGGFTKNPVFLKTLSLLSKERQVMISDHPRASAVGASWIVTQEISQIIRYDLLKLSAV